MVTGMSNNGDRISPGLSEDSVARVGSLASAAESGAASCFWRSVLRVVRAIPSVLQTIEPSAR